MAQKLDPLKGMNPDQSGPKEKIQNGDPHSSPNRDQRSGAREAGGPGPSLDSAEAGGKEGMVPPHDNLEVVKNSNELSGGVDTSEQLPAGAYDRAGMHPDTGVPYDDPTREVEPASEAEHEEAKADADADPETGKKSAKPKAIKKDEDKETA